MLLMPGGAEIFAWSSDMTRQEIGGRIVQAQVQFNRIEGLLAAENQPIGDLKDCWSNGTVVVYAQIRRDNAFGLGRM